MKISKNYRKLIGFLTVVVFIISSYAGVSKPIFDELKVWAEARTSEESLTYGDLNGDGKVNSFDVALFKKKLISKESLSLNIVDVDANGIVNIKDLYEIQDFTLGKTKGFTGEIKKIFNSIDRSVVTEPADGVETQMTAEMAEVAQILKTPLELYKYVLNNVNTEFYYGSRKGAIGTYEQNGGNDYDQSSLLITMLRNLGYTANYAIAEIVITDYDLFNMTSTSDIEAAKRIFTSQGKILENVGAGRYKTEHTLVALELEGVQYPLDPSFKYYKTNTSVDLPGIMNSLESQYDLSSENINLLDVSEKIESSFNEQSIIDIISSRKIIDQNITTLPTSVQYDFFNQDILISPSIPMANCDFIELYLGNFKVFSYPSSYLYNKNLTIEYELTEDAEFYLNEIYGFGINGIDDLTKRLGTYKNLAQIYAVVKIDGKKIANGNSNLLGTKENMRLNVRSAGGVANFEKELIYGGLYSVVFDYNMISPHEIVEGYSKLPQNATEQAKTTENNIFGSSWLMDTLSLLGKSYFSQIDTNNIMAAEFADVHYGRSISVVVVDFTPDIYTQLGETILNRQGKIGIDVLGNQTVFTSRVNNLEEESKLRHATGLLSSFYESEVIKQFTGLQAVSTSEVLNISSEQNIEILYLSSANISELNNSKLSDQNKADITKLINEGNYVTVPSEEISIGNWSGTGYIVYDPVTDLNSYIINTNLNGGQLCSWVGLAYLGSVLLSVVECTWAVYMIAGGIALVMAALGGASLIIGIGIGAFAAVIAFTPVITMIIGAGLIIGGALYLKNVGDRLQNQTELMTRYLDGDSLAGEALKRNAVWQAVGVGTTFVVGRVLSKHVSAATARVHFETNYGRLPGEYGNIPNGYTVANDVANSLVNSGVSTSLIQSASQNVNFISYTPAVINALSRVPTATAEQFVLTIANTNGDGVLIAVDNSGVQIDDVVKLIALHRVDYANTVAVINKIHSSTATSMELMSLYNALTRQTTRTADLVTDAAILERVRVIRNILPSDLKRSGNFGLANVSISGLKNEWYAHSGIDVLSDARSAADLVTDISLQPQNPTVEAIEAPVGSANNYLRDMDTEYKILNDIANQLGDNVNATGTIKLFTERSPCDSCQNIIARFLEKYPNIEIEVVHNDGTVLKP